MADTRGPRLFVDLNNVFKRDPNIDEYDILPVCEPTHNRSPFILQEHKLGVEAWAVKVLIKYVANRLICWRSQSPSVKFIDPIEVLNLTKAVLLFIPDNCTAWNVRKEFVESGFLYASDDLTFGTLILSKHPKSAETFIHRRWLFQHLLNHCLSSSLDSNMASAAAPDGSAAAPDSIAECSVNMDFIDIDIVSCSEAEGPSNMDFSLECSRLFKQHIQFEMEVCGKAAARYPCNYHAWSHRIWIVQNCLNCSVQVLLSELKDTQLWTSTNISDHSGFHYRQFLLTELNKKQEKLLTYSVSLAELFVKEMAYVCDLIDSYPSHEALWYHRRFLFHFMVNSHFWDLKSKSSNGFNMTFDSREENQLQKQKSCLIAQELELVNGVMEWVDVAEQVKQISGCPNPFRGAMAGLLPGPETEAAWQTSQCDPAPTDEAAPVAESQLHHACRCGKSYRTERGLLQHRMLS
ncbi:Protein prenyltransferase alpha subunit repeat-containing protein 1 [Bulinus truncatus]|nr:Protein prenyltransferase alpha subunit repeat-containing protein 1 [Bulinus truncatus]